MSHEFYDNDPRATGAGQAGAGQAGAAAGGQHPGAGAGGRQASAGGQHPGGQQAGAGNPPQGLDLSAVRGNHRTEQTVPTNAASADAVPADAVEVPALVFDVTEATLEAAVQLSLNVPVIIDLWAEWCGPCKQLSPILDRVIQSYGGRLVLAKIDVDANPNLQQAFGVQSIPTVVAIVKGQPVPLFQGALPEPQVKSYFDQLLTLAEQNGVNKTAYVAGSTPPAPAGPKHPEAEAALAAGDLDAAEAEYKAALAEAPADEEARRGLLQVGLAKRLKSADPDAARKAAEANPADIDAHLTVADAEFAAGDLDAAFNRALGLIRTTAGDERDTVRLRLLELFDLSDPADERVTKARSKLMRALF